ncbi:MAG: hypothetical protein ACLFTV_08580 [Desulfococcaceae bacterium]
MADLADRMRNLLHELTHLEVDTIIKPCMTGRKMPKPRHALIEIADNYAARLKRMGYPVDRGGGGRGSFQAFNQIRVRAGEALAAFDKESERRELNETEAVDRVLLFRIQRMSDEIKGLLNNLKHRGVEEWDNDASHSEIEDQRLDLPLEPGEKVQIRKIWEMGLEEIAMQTIIQIDGDMVTRIQPRYAAGERQMIHEIHERSVATALELWGNLIGIVKIFFGEVSGRRKIPGRR